MGLRPLFVLICVLFSIGTFSSSAHDYLNSPRIVIPSKYDALLQAPARRSLLSDSKKKPETALVASLDGTIYLMEVGSLKPLWSFSSGSEIYSSYQTPISNNENPSRVESTYFIDCGDDFELYAHTSLGKLKLMKSVEEYINSTPQIGEDGGIVLGSKKTTAFVVEARTGRLIYTYRMPDSSTSMHTGANDFLYNTTIKEQFQSGSDMKTNELPLYITRTDYGLTSFMPNSDKVLWNMTVADIGAAFLCHDIEKSNGGTLVDSIHSPPNLHYKMPLPCQSRARVVRIRDHNILQTLIMPNGLQEARQQDLMIPASTSDTLPPQPNVEKVLKSLPSFNNSVKTLDARDGQDVKNFELHHVPDVEMFSDDDLTTAHGKFCKFFILLCVILVVYVANHFKNIFSRVKEILAAQFTGRSSTSLHSKRKRSRKSGKSGSNVGKPDEEENVVKHTPKESENNFWRNLDQPSSCSTDGRKIGKLFVSSKEIAKGSNGTIVFEGIYEGRPVAVKRLVKAYNDIAEKEIQNLIASDRHPNIVRWFGVEEDQDFVYLALERCACSLNDLIFMQSKSDISISGKNLDNEIAAECTVSSDSLRDFELWKSDGYPSPLLLKLMRDITSGIAHLHELKIVHRDLKPQNVLIISERSLSAKLSDMGISKRLNGDMSSMSNHDTGCGSPGWRAPEQILDQRLTRAVDMFSLGCVLFFCITGGRHPFGKHIERDCKIAKCEVDLSLFQLSPEAEDLLQQLLDRDAEKRPKAVEVLYHPLFWSAETRLSFLRDASDKVELEDRKIDSDLLKALESTFQLALGAKWNEKMEPSFLNNIGRYRRYKYDSVRDLLRVMRNKLNHYRELPAEIQEIVGPVPEGFDRYFTSRFPKLLIAVYKVMLEHCRTEQWFAKYLRVRGD